MNPVSKLELSARTIWNSALAPEEKGRRLEQLHGIISRYLVQVDEMEEANRKDPEAARNFFRTREALSRLAGNVQELADRCVSGKRAKAA